MRYNDYFRLKRVNSWGHIVYWYGRFWRARPLSFLLKKSGWKQSLFSFCCVWRW
nr:MAG TPA_asm: hypothetical protein [Caudoviricetes sp.]